MSSWVTLVIGDSTCHDPGARLVPTCLHAMQCKGCRPVQPCCAFYMSAGNLRAGPHLVQPALRPLSVSPALLFAFLITCKSVCFVYLYCSPWRATRTVVCMSSAVLLAESKFLLELTRLEMSTWLSRQLISQRTAHSTKPYRSTQGLV